MNLYIVPYFKEYDATKIKKNNIIRWQKSLYNNLSVSYINKIRSVLHNFFKFMCDFHDLEGNPVSQAPILKDNTPEDEIAFWEFAEFKKIYIKSR